MISRLVLLIALLGGACREASRELPGSQDDDAPIDLTPPTPPCDGCTLDVPLRRGPVPLLVVLHGDREAAATAADRWRPTALARGWAVLSLQCPRDHGCDEQRWYRGKQDPRWVHAQVAAVATQRALDPMRIYLAGWSGGASFIGTHAPAWSDTFAAVVFHGGGQPPASERCPSRALPAYFLVGDRNPAHAAAQRLREYWQDCALDAEWDLLPGANHAKEDEALDAARALEILAWLDDHARTPLVSTR